MRQRGAPRRGHLAVLVVVAVLGGVIGSVRAAPEAVALPSGFFDQKISGVAGVAFAAQSPGRVFVAEKLGRVRLVVDGALKATPVIDLSNQVNRAVDRGLLGLALDKDFASNGHLYLAYTAESHGTPQSTDPRTACISRVTVVGDTASRTSEVPIIGKDGCGKVDSCSVLPAGADCIEAEYVTHGNGAIRVDADGNLWTTMGDGSPANSPQSLTRAQGIDHLNGKLLKVTPTGQGLPTNPFYDGNPNSNRSKVYAYGLRNAFRFGFRPGGPAYLADVGASAWEEINVATPGANFGWPCYEGNVRYRPYENSATCQALYARGTAAHQKPLHVYSHEGGSASIIGGAFYSGAPSEYDGSYIYADFIKGEFRSLQPNGTDTAIASGPTPFGSSTGVPVDIQMGPDGCLWYAAFGDGQGTGPALRRICFTDGNRSPIAKATATPGFGALPLSVQFSATGSSDPDGDPLTYAWDFGDGATSTLAQPSHTYTSAAVRTARLTVRDSAGLTAQASVTVYAGDRPPVPVIDTPTTAYRFKVGSTVAFSGRASDPDQGTLAASRLRWAIQIVHCPGGTTQCHTHSMLDRTGVASGTWHVDDHGDSYRFRITLTATDAQGLARSVTREVLPQTVVIRLESSPTGRRVAFDETTRTAPASFVAIVGSKHRISFPAQAGWAFVRWSDGGAIAHDITATAARTYTVTARAR